jgi:hypothetical protein
MARMNEKPRHRRFRFSLTTLFLLVALVAVWLGWSWNWIRQRHEFLRNKMATSLNVNPVTAPGMLWLFGEEGCEYVFMALATDNDLEEARRLFPEASVQDVFQPP